MSGATIRVGIEAVELRGPGLPGWRLAQPVLAGTSEYREAPIILEAPIELSAAERRRAIPSVKLALGVAASAVAQSGLHPATLPAVFASSGADGDTIAAILSALAAPDREVSPTRFHNSVHNAPSGYWGVAMQSREPVTSVSCYDASFAAALLETAVQTTTNDRPTLLVAYDLPYPEPLASLRRIEASFGIALVISPVPSDQALAALEITLSTAPAGAASPCADPGLEALRRGNPAARSLPLLTLIAARATGSVRIDLSHAALDVTARPC